MKTRLVGTLAVAALVSACADDRLEDTSAPSRAGRIEPGADIGPQEIPREEYVSRRRILLETLPDGIVLLHARATEKSMEQWGFVQDASFYYYSGLAELPSAILALDGPARSVHLFLPPPPAAFGMGVPGVVPEAGPATAEQHGFDSARSWDEFAPWLRSRLEQGVRTAYLDEARNPEPRGVPQGMPRVAGPHALWRASLEAAFPGLRIQSAEAALVRLRSVKSEREVRVLERNAQMTVSALRAAARRIGPGVRQRDVESAVVEACIAAGGEGPSFWPWTMSGPNAHVEQLVGAFYRYDQGDRAAAAGELVRVDIGCASGYYGADVGRTIPVSGRFTQGQSEAWNLLLSGYRAGLDAIADGVPVQDVRAASTGAIREAQPSLATEEGRAAAAVILAGGDGTWHIHGVGLESGEDIPEVLRAGMVVAYEPGFSVGPDAYYLEDMVLVTEAGHRVLSAELPYTAREIEELMRIP